MTPTQRNDPRRWARGLRMLCLRLLERHGPTSVSELAALASQPPANIGPRLSELADAGLVVCTDLRRSGGRGQPAKVWAVADEVKRSQFNLALQEYIPGL